MGLVAVDLTQKELNGITLICIIINSNIILLPLLISLNYYCYYNVCFAILMISVRNYHSLSYLFVHFFVCFLQLCAPAIYRSPHVVSVHYVPMYICTVLCR
jgi:succinate-acetate transporter protein